MSNAKHSHRVITGVRVCGPESDPDAVCNMPKTIVRTKGIVDLVEKPEQVIEVVASFIDANS